MHLRPRNFVAFIALVVVASALTAAEPSKKPTTEPPAESTDTAPVKQKPKPTTARDRRAARDAAAKAKKEADRTAWLAKLKERNVQPWPENETDDEHVAALKKSREMATEVIGLFPGSQLVETDHFLVITNIPPQQMRPYIASLDRMYDWMCKLYGVERDHKVWLGGKAPIFAFLQHAEFDAFEQRFYPEARETFSTLSNIYGLSHLKQSGEVVISCYRGDDPNNFGQMLVHETSHGFIHRYKTKVHLPNWVDEGMADLIGAEIVPGSTAVKNREYRALQQLTQTHSFAGMFDAKRIEAQHYGMASNLTRFMLQTNRDDYVRFIEALKDGEKWEDALKTSYRSTPDELITAYARAIKVQSLQPK